MEACGLGRVYGDIDKKAVLLKSTVTVVARGGIDNASTRMIGKEAGFQDAFIYRYFKDKEDLLAYAYLLEREKFLNLAIRCIDRVREQMADQKLLERYRTVFHTSWRYLLDTPDVCRFLVYYYNSPNFEKYARMKYQEQSDSLTSHIVHLYDSEEYAKMCMYALFILLNSFGLRVVNGDLPDNAETEDKVCRVTYSAFCAHIKDSLLENTID